MRTNKREAARRKLLGILPRHALEQASGLEKPWHTSRGDLVTICASHWDEDEVREQIERIFSFAKEPDATSGKLTGDSPSPRAPRA